MGLFHLLRTLFLLIRPRSFLFIGMILYLGTYAFAEDWPQWCRDNSRNMVAPARNLPDNFDPGKLQSDGSDPDPASTKGIKWVSQLGSQSYGNTTIAGGRVFIGTNNDPGRDPRIK